MSLTSKELDRISHLCAIPLSIEEKTKFLWQLDAIIGFMNQLDNVKTFSFWNQNQSVLFPQISPLFNDSDALLKNVNHRMQQGGIIVKSAVHAE